MILKLERLRDEASVLVLMLIVRMGVDSVASGEGFEIG